MLGQDVSELLGPPPRGSGKKEFISSTHTCQPPDLDQDLFWTLVTVPTKVTLGLVLMELSKSDFITQ